MCLSKGLDITERREIIVLLLGSDKPLISFTDSKVCIFLTIEPKCRRQNFILCTFVFMSRVRPIRFD